MSKKEENERGAVIRFDRVFKIMTYECSMSAYENPTGGWIYSLQYLTKNPKSKKVQFNFMQEVDKDIKNPIPNSVFEIYGQKIYKTYKDALQDGYGVLEYLGFVIPDRTKRAVFCIHKWDKEKETFKEESVYFDGYDFFETP